MSDTTKIEWADATWNPMTGCTPVSEACGYCYAERMARRFNSKPCTCGLDGLPWHSPYCPAGRHFAPTFHPDRLDKPLHWRKPRRIFVCSMSDLFHEAFRLTEFSGVLSVVMACPQHTFLVLTKRAELMQAQMRWFYETQHDGVLPNLWLGVTAENQQRADERIPVLLDTPAAVRFVSVEPMLGPVRLGCAPDEMGFTWLFGPQMSGGIDWVILGGETGPGARPMQPEWALDVYRQCKAAGVPFFWKKAGSHWGDVGRAWAHPHPEMLATREFPAVTP